MSRSYRKPYSAVTGLRSAADDKRIARRAVRRRQNQKLREAFDWDEFLIPHKYECAFNDTWSWGRDGNQYLRFKPTLEEAWHCMFWITVNIHYRYPTSEEVQEEFQRRQDYFDRLCRK